MCHDGIWSSKERDHFFKTKPGLIRDPQFYLGEKLKQLTLPNGVQARAMSPSKYIQAAVNNVKASHSQMYPMRRWAKRTTSIPFPLN